ncbi:MAG: hypothetical protein V5A24_02415 [Haloarculaceae archaeon]
MELPRAKLVAVARIGAYLLLGFVGTAAVALATLNLTLPVQPVIYDLFYLRLGPSMATETAILGHFFVSILVGLAVPVLIGDYLSDRWANLREMGLAIATMVGVFVLFLVVAVAGIDPFLTALIMLALGLVSVPLALRFGAGVRSGGVPVFVGGIPVIVFLLLLAGFGIGWGWGYIVSAEEVPESTVSEPAADFSEVPEVAADLFVRGDCDTTTDDRRRCRLSVRGYDREVRTIRFLADQGVRCPSHIAGSGSSGSFVAEYEGRYYRITCSPHGD